MEPMYVALICLIVGGGLVVACYFALARLGKAKRPTWRDDAHPQQQQQHPPPPAHQQQQQHPPSPQQQQDHTPYPEEKLLKDSPASGRVDDNTSVEHPEAEGDDGEERSGPLPPVPETPVVVAGAAAGASQGEEVVRNEAAGRERLQGEEAVAFEKIERAWERLNTPFGAVGSLGVRLCSPTVTDTSAVVMSVRENSAAASPLTQETLQPGDVIVAVVTSNGEWPIYRREHFMTAVGPRGHTFEGSEVTLRVLRRPEHVARWKAAIQSVLASRRTAFPLVKSPHDNPLPPGVPLTALPRFDPSAYTEVRVRMGKMSEETRVRRLQAVKDMRRFFPPGFGGDLDAECILAFQSDPKTCREILLGIFNKYDEDQSGTLDAEEFEQVHHELSERAGVPPMQPHLLEEAFQEADTDGNGVLSFDEFFPYLRELLLESLYSVEERKDLASFAVSPTSADGAAGQDLLTL